MKAPTTPRQPRTVVLNGPSGRPITITAKCSDDELVRRATTTWPSATVVKIRNAQWSDLGW